MLIFNDIDILERYAENEINLLEVETIDCTVNNEFIWINGVKPINRLSYSNGAIKVTLLIEGDTNVIGRLISEISTGVLRHKETHFNTVMLTNYEHKRIIEDVYEVSLEYSASFKMLEEVKRIVSADNFFEYEGTVESPVNIKAISKGTQCSFTINDSLMSFNNIKANDIIEVIENRILINGIDSFSKCDLNKFPKLIKDTNNITLNNCTLELNYNPLML